MRNTKLQKLYQQVDRCKFCKTEGNKLQHIHGFGAMNPKLMLVLINPTYRNLSSAPEYRGNRFPFIGVRQFWRVLADGGLISEKVAFNLPSKAEWSGKHSKQVENELFGNKLFLTNVVKCCYNHSAYPDSEVIKNQRNLLAQEIKLVNPKKIVAFGTLVYQILTGQPIKLSEYWNRENKIREREIITGLGMTVIPCYFPIGRGNPRKAVEILRKLARPLTITIKIATSLSLR